MNVLRTKRIWVAAAPLLAAGAFGLFQKPASAEKPSSAESIARCATRLKTSFLGKGATDAELKAADPQAAVDAYLKAPEFVELFARFLNSELNPAPGMTSAEDATYHLGKYVLSNDLPYKDLFLGKFNVVVPNAQQPNNVVVQPDPNGLGYFRSRAWLVRYAGNELAGIKIVTGYRIMQNITGLKLQAVSNAEGVDTSKAGRSAGVCAQCHFQDWSALDKVASILTVRKGTGATMTFDPPAATTVDIDGKAVTDDASLAARLVESENYNFNTCRLAFKFLYGRPENTCESQVFDKCVTEFKKTGKIQTALSTIAKDDSFCQ